MVLLLLRVRLLLVALLVIAPAEVSCPLPPVLLLVRIRWPVPIVIEPANARVEPPVLFSVMPVTFGPMIELMETEPASVPELVIVPMLLTVEPERRMPLPNALLLFNIRLPVPVMAPVIFNCLAEEELVKVRPPLLTLTGPLTVVAEVTLACVMPVTFEPIPPLIVTAPALVLELITVPVLFMAVPENVRAAALPLLLRTRLFVPVTPPLKTDAKLPDVPIEIVPVVPERRTIAFP